jgi:NADPH:quinone reductase-like Zn-dependent oxidoreductase
VKAWVYDTYGGPEVLRFAEDIPERRIGTDEVLIRTAATSFNPVDAKIRQGARRDILPLKFPHIPGVDVSGVVAKIGDEVSGLTVGQRVYAYLNAQDDGGAAEYVVTKAVLVAAAPQIISLQDAAALPCVALTAWQGLFELGTLQAGQRILIIGAGGGVGHIAVQLAKWKDAFVIGTSSKTPDDDLLRLGIDQLINYRSERVADALGEKVDVILNAATMPSDEINAILALLKPNGILVSTTGPADEAYAAESGVRSVGMVTRRDAQGLQRLAELVDAGSLRPLIAARVPFGELASVHEQADPSRGFTRSGARGKTVIVVDETL